MYPISIMTTPRVIRIGLSRERCDYIARFGQQQSDYWCWSASISMVLMGCLGIQVSQRDIATVFPPRSGVFGPAYAEEITNILSHYWHIGRGQVRSLRAQYRDIDGRAIKEMLDVLTASLPLIQCRPPQGSGSIGHACVIVAAEWDVDAQGMQLSVPRIIYADPASGGLVTEEWNQFYALSPGLIFISEGPSGEFS